MGQDAGNITAAVDQIDAVNKRCAGDAEAFRREMNRLARVRPQAFAAYVEREYGIEPTFAADGHIDGYKQHFLHDRDDNLSEFIRGEALARDRRCRAH